MKNTKSTIEDQILSLYNKYNDLYIAQNRNSEDIQRYWENEFYWGKREAFEEVLELLKKKTTLVRS